MNTSTATFTKLSTVAAIALATATAAAAFALGAGAVQPKREIVKLERVVIEGKRVQTIAKLPRVVIEGRRSVDTQLASAAACRNSETVVC